MGHSRRQIVAYRASTGSNEEHDQSDHDQGAEERRQHEPVAVEAEVAGCRIGDPGKTERVHDDDRRGLTARHGYQAQHGQTQCRPLAPGTSERGRLLGHAIRETAVGFRSLRDLGCIGFVGSRLRFFHLHAPGSSHDQSQQTKRVLIMSRTRDPTMATRTHQAGDDQRRPLLITRLPARQLAFSRTRRRSPLTLRPGLALHRPDHPITMLKISLTFGRAWCALGC